MSQINSAKRNGSSRKLSLNRETLRSISADRLEQVAGGFSGSSIFPTSQCPPATDPAIYCGPLR